jgi:hypothetical protein
MRARLTGLVLAVVVLAVGASSVLAATDSGTLRLTWNTDYQSSPGGEFQVYDWTDDAVPADRHVYSVDSVDYTGDYFQTFCIESNEYISKDVKYDWELNDRAVAGGDSSDDPYDRGDWGEYYGGDKICPETAWLYTQFWDGGMSVSSGGDTFTYIYTLGGSRRNSAKHLQTAIWWLEGEDSTAFASLDLEVRTMINAALDEKLTGIGAVRVLNLSLNGEAKQDQLVMTDGTTTHEVPLPPAAPLGLVLLCGMGFYARLRRRMRG